MFSSRVRNRTDSNCNLARSPSSVDDQFRHFAFVEIRYFLIDSNVCGTCDIDRSRLKMLIW